MKNSRYPNTVRAPNIEAINRLMEQGKLSAALARIREMVGEKVIYEYPPHERIARTYGISSAAAYAIFYGGSSRDMADAMEKLAAAGWKDDAATYNENAMFWRRAEVTRAEYQAMVDGTGLEESSVAESGDDKVWVIIKAETGGANGFWNGAGFMASRRNAEPILRSDVHSTGQKYRTRTKEVEVIDDLAKFWQKRNGPFGSFGGNTVAPRFESKRARSSFSLMSEMQALQAHVRFTVKNSGKRVTISKHGKQVFSMLKADFAAMMDAVKHHMAGTFGDYSMEHKGDSFVIKSTSGELVAELNPTDMVNLRTHVVAENVDQDYEEWQKAVLRAYPAQAKRIKFKGRIEGKLHTISAEIPGEDRSYGVWDQDTDKGVVLSETPRRLATK